MYRPLSLLLVSLLVLSACGGTRSENTLKETLPTVEATEEPAFCENDGAIFMLGDDVFLGTEPDGDYSAVLSAGDSSFLHYYTLTLYLKDGAEFSPNGGSLPESGETVTIKWGPYLEIEVENCGLYYHYKVVKLLGASARPVTDLACIPADYSQEGLKPWPFASYQVAWTGGVKEVWLVSTSSSGLFLVRFEDEAPEEEISFRRPLKGETTTGSINIGTVVVSVAVKNCDGNYFFKVQQHKRLEVPPPAHRLVKWE